jgi:hypothetical protein
MKPGRIDPTKGAWLLIFSNAPCSIFHTWRRPQMALRILGTIGQVLTPTTGQDHYIEEQDEFLAGAISGHPGA